MHEHIYEDMAKEAAGNHRNFTSFAWFDRPEDDENWTIVYTHTRDSTLLDLSNADVIKEELSPFMEGDDPDVVSERHSHWGPGWVEGFVIRVYKDGKVTAAFRKWAELKASMDDYPILDESN